jgi:hypothetical protein
MQGVSKITLQWHSKCYGVESVTKIFALKGVKTIHRSPLIVHLSVNAFITIATQ